MLDLSIVQKHEHEYPVPVLSSNKIHGFITASIPTLNTSLHSMCTTCWLLLTMQGSHAPCKTWKTWNYEAIPESPGIHLGFGNFREKPGNHLEKF